MKRKSIESIVLLLTAATFCAVTSHAIPPFSNAFTYQGRLMDGGVPANGTYDLGFVLHEDPTNFNYIGNSIIAPAVPVTNGLFTVQLNSNNEFGPDAFNGEPRWLEIDVRTNNNILVNNFTVLTPRQPLTPTPLASFAMNAGTAANASFASNVADGSVTSSKLAPGAIAWTNIAGLPAGFADGIDNDTHYLAGAGLSLSATNQFSVNFAGSGVANTAARSDHYHFGASWNGNSSGFGLIVANNSTTGSGVYAQQGSGSGVLAPFDYKAAVWAESSQGDAIYGATANATGAGVYGYGTAVSGPNFGVYGQSDSPNGVGVLARGSGTTGTALRISNGAIRVTGAGVATATPVFTHAVTPANLKTNTSFFPFGGSVINNPYCNNDPNAILVLTASGGTSIFSFTPPSIVMYDNGEWGMATNRWVIIPADPFNNNLNPGHQYNVIVFKP